MTFNAQSAVEPMGYDFTAFGGKASAIPEPSTDQIVKFWTDYAEHLALISLDKVNDEGVDNFVRSTANRAKMRAMIAAVCSDVPSVDEIAALPGRIESAFTNYVMESLSPEASTSATS